MSEERKIIEVIDEFYSVISGSMVEVRDWERFRRLFHAGAKLAPIRYDGEGRCITFPPDVESYISGLDKFSKHNDFYEYGFDYQIKIFRDLAQVSSRYEARPDTESEEIIKRGTNLVHLIKDHEDWKILWMSWQDD